MTDTLATMPRPATGTIEPHQHADGKTITWRLRVRHEGERVRVTLGTNAQGWNRERAQVELDRILAEIRRGTWERPRPAVRAEIRDDETFHVFISRWWTEKKPTLTDRGREDYWWRIQKLLMSRDLAATPVADITKRTVDAQRARLLADGLGARSVNMVLGLFAQVLDAAVDYDLLDVNPARGRKRRVKEPAKARAFLEADMVRDLLDEAGRLEAKARPGDRYGRRAILATLCLAGPRIAEALEVPRGALDLHGGGITLGRKTEAGTGRRVELTAFLAGELRAHLAAAVAHGRPTSADVPLFCTRTGGRQSESQIRNRLLRDAVASLNKARAKKGLALLPHVTPHVLRRTFASLSLAAGRDPRWLMGQMGHTDARLTLSIYAQVMQRQGLDLVLISELMAFPGEEETCSRTITADTATRGAGRSSLKSGGAWSTARSVPSSGSPIRDERHPNGEDRQSVDSVNGPRFDPSSDSEDS